MIFPFFMRTVVSSGQLLTRARSHWPAAVVGRGGSNSTSDSGFYRRQYFPGTPKEVEPNRGNLRDNQSGVCEPGEFRSRSTSAVWPTANGRRLVFFFQRRVSGRGWEGDRFVISIVFELLSPPESSDRIDRTLGCHQKAISRQFLRLFFQW